MNANLQVSDGVDPGADRRECRVKLRPWVLLHLLQDNMLEPMKFQGLPVPAFVPIRGVKSDRPRCAAATTR